MKLLNENQMVELLEATAADRDLLAKRMGPTLDAGTAAWFAAEVNNKHLNVTTVVCGGRKLGAIWWWYSEINKSLVLNAGASFVYEDTTPAFMIAYDRLAKQTGARSMELTTARAGVVKIYRQAGWAVEGLAMRKILTREGRDSVAP